MQSRYVFFCSQVPDSGYVASSDRYRYSFPKSRSFPTSTHTAPRYVFLSVDKEESPDSEHRDVPLDIAAKSSALGGLNGQRLLRLLDPDIKNLRIYEYTECSCIIQNATQNREHIRDCLGRKTGFILFPCSSRCLQSFLTISFVIFSIFTVWNDGMR